MVLDGFACLSGKRSSRTETEFLIWRVSRDRLAKRMEGTETTTG